MKFKFYFASFTALFWVLNGFAQKQNVYFLKNDGREVKLKDSADFIRIVREPDSGTVLYNVLEYYLNGNQKMIGKSSTIDPITLEGTSASFYPNKKRKQVANYEKGYMLGVVYDYYQNGKLYRSLEYVDNKNRSPQPGSMGKEEIIHLVYDSTGVETVKEGNGHYPIFGADYQTIEEEGDVKNGKRNGVWKGTSNKGKISFTEEYADGKFIKGTSTDESGSTKNYTIKEALPTFKGGEKGFGNYLSNNLRYPPDSRERGIQGRVLIGFVVETDGSLTNIRILKGVQPDLDAEALRVIKQSPKWNPGTQHGVPVKVSYAMPLNFSLGN
ncbi:MAG: TonB family protein [Mucilaginibacter sp.]|uniref:TonB family protein n=1 Tax=Mucilaginibacter sp. TaxID=1882438 RepID=UPI0034E46EE2